MSAHGGDGPAASVTGYPVSGVRSAMPGSGAVSGPATTTAPGGVGTSALGAVTATTATATAAIRQLFNTEDHAALFRQLDEDFIKPKLLD